MKTFLPLILKFLHTNSQSYTTYSPPLSVFFYLFGKLYWKRISNFKQGETFMKDVGRLSTVAQDISSGAQELYIDWEELEPVVKVFPCEQYAYKARR
jgi:hypothetical protein